MSILFSAPLVLRSVFILVLAGFVASVGFAIASTTRRRRILWLSLASVLLALFFGAVIFPHLGKADPADDAPSTGSDGSDGGDDKGEIDAGTEDGGAVDGGRGPRICIDPRTCVNP